MVDDLPDDINDWLTYFPQVKLHILGGNTYMALLIGLSVPFPKLVKSLSSWMRSKHYAHGKPIFNWSNLHHLDGCCFPHWWWMQTYSRKNFLTILRIFGWVYAGKPLASSVHKAQAIPKDQQMKALHVYVDELDINMAKPLLIALYASKTLTVHKFPLHIWMHLVPELDAVLNTKGHQIVEKLCVCQNTWT